ncbi:MAG: hypothetical protein HYV07_26145 [Deltaproteobacteria bacterium]|nr:hypothetical protein [Deltaproteobacteria bacterium]
MRRSTVAWLAVALTALVSSGAGAAPTRVGLVVNLRVNVDEQRADELAAALGKALRAKERVDVVAGAEVSRRLQPDGVPEDCVARPECVDRVAVRLDADELLFLVLVKIGDTVQVDATWAAKGGERTLSRDQIVLESSPDEQVFAQAASGLLPPGRRGSSVPTGSDTGQGTGQGTATAPRRAVSTVASSPAAPGVLPVAIAGGVAILALAGGIGLAITTRDDYESALDLGCDSRVCGAREEIILDELGQRGLLTNVLFATAAVAGVTTMLLHLANLDAPVSARTVRLASVEPSISTVGLASAGGGAVLTIGGTL